MSPRFPQWRLIGTNGKLSRVPAPMPAPIRWAFVPQGHQPMEQVCVALNVFAAEQPPSTVESR